MVDVLSKFVKERLSWRSCNELLHPHSCSRSTMLNFWPFVWSNSKYYLPVALLHLLKHLLTGINAELLWDAFIYYVELVFGGLVNACIISTSMCLLRNALGEFRQYTLLFVPAAIGGSFITFISPRVKQLQHTAIFQCFIESILLQRGNWVTKSIVSSLAVQTLVFMCCSALILHGKQRYKGFWFVKAEDLQCKNQQQSSSCSHTETDCVLHVAKGVRNYFLIGLALDIFKGLVNCIKSKLWKIKHMKLESTAWLTCYVFIYRASHCYMRQNYAGSDSLKHLLASFLGGLSYLCYPKLTILSYAVLEAWRTFWSRRSKKARTWDYSDALFPLALAYLIHTYVFQPHRVSTLAGIIIDSTTANYTVIAELKNFGLTTSFGSCLNALTFYLMCIGRRVSGRYIWGWTPYMACWLAFQLCWLMPPRVLQLFVTGISHAALEGLLRQWNVALVHSRAYQTFVFMICSMLVLTQQQAKRYFGFWFIKPKILPANYNKSPIGERILVALKELVAYVGIGLALDVLNTVMRSKQRRLELKSTLFLGSYMGVYKLIQCLLADKLDIQQVNSLAAFVSGSAFTFVNRLTIMSFSLVIATQVLWKQFCARDAGDGKLGLLQRIPWAKLLIPTNVAYLVHSLFFQQHVVNSLAQGFIDSTCDKNAQRMYNLLMLPNVEDIMAAAFRRPTTSFI